jgi:hypothetical protein
MEKRGKILMSILIVLLLFLTIRLLQYQFIENYDCSEMSRDLELFFEGIGIDCHVARGDMKYFGGGGHAWIQVNILGWYMNVDSVSVFPFPMYILHDNITIYENYEDYNGKNSE